MTNVPRIEPERRWANRHVIHQPDPRRLQRAGAVIAAVVAAFAPTLVYLWQQNECLRLSYRVAAQRERYEDLVETERRLRLQGTEHASLDAVERWAIRERGLVRPEAEAVVVVRSAPPRGTDLVARGK